MIICCCNKATGLCADTCLRWRNTCGPDRVYLIPTWPKNKDEKYIAAAIYYSKSLDWPDKEK